MYFRKILNYITYHKSPSSGSRIIPFGRADGRTENRHDGDNIRFSQFSKTNKRPCVINQAQVHICYTITHAVIYLGHYTSNLDVTLNFFRRVFRLRIAKLGSY